MNRQVGAQAGKNRYRDAGRDMAGMVVGWVGEKDRQTNRERERERERERQRQRQRDREAERENERLF